MADQDDVRALQLLAVWEAGRAAWPDLALDAATFTGWLGARLEPGQDPTALVAPDLYLAAACLLDVPDAARHLIDGPLAAIERHVARVVAGRPDASKELLQELAVALLVPGPDGSPPRLAQYGGRGPLVVWLRMTAVRRALNQGRGAKKNVSLEDAALDQIADQDPELSVLRRRHRTEIGEIFREAIAAIAHEDRTLLRLHYVQGTTLNELATIYRTSRSSMHRRVELARATLLERIGELVRSRLRLVATEQESLLRVFKSDLRDALGALLGGRREAGRE